MSERIPLGLCAGDLVTLGGEVGKAPLPCGPSSAFGIVTEMYQDAERRWLAKVIWFRHPQRRNNRMLGANIEAGSYYNFRYSSCTQWIERL